ncbi:hypothetical protein MMC25_006444 [Agyrium rufum]|nr:hypothetical protein [Agyrium rufum]
MAKGLRSSVKKANKTKLRARVFAPVENARMERLSSKLLEIASSGRPQATEDVSMKEATKADATSKAEADPAIVEAAHDEEDMEIDGTRIKRRKSSSKHDPKARRVHKGRGRASSSTMMFASKRKPGRVVGQRKKKT